MPTDAPLLRRWAMECAASAADPKIMAEDRKRLLKMREALLQLARTQDRLDGKKAPLSPPSSPTQQQQLQPGRRKARPKTSRSAGRA
jgi:hypothetical protein